MDLLALFVASLGDRALELRGHEAEARRLLDEARARAGDRVPPADLMAGLAARLPAGDLLAGLGRLRVEELGLVLAACAGEPTAVAEMTTLLAEESVAAGRALKADASLTDEVRQRLCEHFLIGSADRPPVLREYSARGDLRGYLRISATREHLRLMRRERREVGMETDDLSELVPAADPELDRLKAAYAVPFNECFIEALGGLTPRERTLLRHQAIDRLSIDQIGALYGAHRATAARWLERARQKLAETTEDLLAARLTLGSLEAKSVIRLVRSQLDVSLDKLLASDRGK